jgi:choline dehydrogenase
LQHLLLESRPELTVPDLMFVSVRIPFVSAQLGARYAIPPNAFCVGT